MSTNQKFSELLILEELANNRDATQRYLAERIQVSLGTINWFIKRLVDKGWIKVKRLNSRNLRYILTPDGLQVHASRNLELLNHHLVRYQEARRFMADSVEAIATHGHKRILVAASKLWAELAFVAIRAYHLGLVGFVGGEGENLLDYPVYPVNMPAERWRELADCLFIVDVDTKPFDELGTAFPVYIMGVRSRLYAEAG